MTAPSEHSLHAVASLLLAHEREWRSLGVRRVRVFGSVARGEATDLSDVDLLVDLHSGAGLLDLMAAKDLFENLLQRRIDVLTEGALKPQLRRGILTDAVDVTDLPPQLHRTHRVKRWRWRVYDLLDALDRVTDVTADHTAESFLRDWVAQDCVLHNMARLGETTKFIPQSVQDHHPEIPWALLRDIRNLVAHDYFGIDQALVWQTAREELPGLRPLLQALAQDQGDSPAQDP
ncbi:HepT-like ribonuclease domain-containing protein [Deinococcus lacus]|uniref:HepT-like ribonuclease domain-containing protein n=1 Tax=Deinococcus lacus TaxID=392561 RepID=A0ABW1YCS9_9DEIO